MKNNDEVLENAQLQINIQRAEKELIEAARVMVPKEAEDEMSASLREIFILGGTPFDATHLTAFLEGLKFSLTQMKDEDKSKLLLIVLTVLKIRDSILQNGISINEDKSTTPKG